MNESNAVISKRDKENLLEEEYEGIFDGEEKAVHKLMKVKSKLNISIKTINIDDIIISNFKKISREDSVVGLTGVIGEWGVVSPIHVLLLETEGVYLLLDGLRRVFGALRNGQEEISAIVWDFEDKQEGKDMANVISLMVNRSQKFTAKEMWEQMQILEEVNDVGPGLIEFLLQMNSGDAMKLKDIMLADMDYSDIKDALLSGELSIDAAYKKLTNQRKKENRLAKEDKISLEDTGLEESQRLGVDEVKELLELSDEDIGNLTLEDMDRTNEIRDVTYQDTQNRHPIDKAIKQATLLRDGFKCRCCGLNGKQWLSVLVYHHLIPVYAGGPDTVENGLTACINCHITLHDYIFGKIFVDLKTLSDSDKETFKNIFKYGNIAIEATRRIGLKKEDAYQKDAGSRRHPFPGENINVNKAAYDAGEALSKNVKNIKG